MELIRASGDVLSFIGGVVGLLVALNATRHIPKKQIVERRRQMKPPAE